MTQTLAIFLDAYRELNARKLFWITLIISGVVVLVFALIGINENGLRIIAWDVAIPGVNSKVVPPATFYKSMFLNLGIGFWLGWIASILALVSTAGIFPDFVSAGSIDLVLSRPIGRLRLFLTKYSTGLLFVALQVTVFSIASFLVLGLKGGAWLPAVFLAIPIVVIFFSYLFCICTLLGLLTRSTIAALLLTLLLWFLIFAVGASENGILTWKLMNAQQMKWQQSAVQIAEANLERFNQRDEQFQREAAREKDALERELEQARTKLRESQTGLRRVDIAHNIAVGIKTALPKTTETIGLLERWMIDLAELKQMTAEAAESSGSNRRRSGNANIEDVQMETVEALRSRSIWWVMGTSLIFEAVVLSLGAWVFCRRDF